MSIYFRWGKKRRTELFLLTLGFIFVLGSLALSSCRLYNLERKLTSQYDERDIPFSRFRLKPGIPEYQIYYAMRPEKKAPDDEVRKLPGLLCLSAPLADPFLFASPSAGSPVSC